MPRFLIFLCASFASQFTDGYVTSNPMTRIFHQYQNTTIPTITSTTTTGPPLVQLRIRAVPDYLITTQPVLLSCVPEVSVPESITWIWERQTVVDKGLNVSKSFILWHQIYTADNTTWTEEGSGPELTLTRPDQSGAYRCRAHSPNRQFKDSNLHPVYIADVHRTVVDNLGIAGFAVSILAIILNLAVVIWLACQKPVNNATSTVPITKTCPPNIPKPMNVAPPVDSDGDVYMNYICSNQGYMDLDPHKINEDNLYSNLS